MTLCEFASITISKLLQVSGLLKIKYDETIMSIPLINSNDMLMIASSPLRNNYILMKKLTLLVWMLCAYISYSHAQTIELQGKVIDKLTKEPIPGASIKVKNLSIGKTDAFGRYKVSVFNTDTLYVSCAGFKTCCHQPGCGNQIILEQEIQTLKEIVVTAGRTAESRRESPVALSTIGTLMLKETKANSLDQVLNKASGVFMVNLGNEQHQMSIRQPMTTKSLFLYLEDGIPVRTTGLYNHNALIEMNMASMKQIEVIKGPASAIYGAEAIGGAINVITLSAPAQTTGQISIQANTNGYKRTDIQYGDSFGKGGVLVSGYYANSTGGRLQHSDFSKAALTVKGHYNFNMSTRLINSISYNNYYSDMFGALDSSHYADRNFSSLNNFTFRKVKALRVKSQLSHMWADFAETKASWVYRNNSIDQNPAYKIKNDYRRVSGGTYKGDPLRAHGEINTSEFNTFAFFLQHDQKLEKLRNKISAGLNVDFSPSHYHANYIGIDKNEDGYFTGYSKSDSALSHYSTTITNLASYLSYNQDVLKGLKLVAAIRYDYYHYNYQNKLSASSFSGAPDTENDFMSFTPKLGLTYNYKNIGFYTNFSQGFVPPQISELYQGVKVPYLSPQTFYNYEVGGWLELYSGKIYADWSLYSMKGTNEIISVLSDDGTSKNENAGITRHIGFEYGLNYRPSAELKLRFSGANSRHIFIEFVEKGLNYNGNIMAGAPKFLANGEISYRPAFVKGLRTSIEWQHQSSYWLDNINSKKYGGFNVYNVRGAYQFKQFEIWLNILNAADAYYSVAASKSASGYSYNLGQPRTFNTGISYQLVKK